MSSFINELKEGRLKSINIDNVCEYDSESSMYIPLIEWCIDASYINFNGSEIHMDWDISSFSEYMELMDYIKEEEGKYKVEKTFGYFKLGI